MPSITKAEAMPTAHAYFNLALEKIYRNDYLDALDFLTVAVDAAPRNALYLSYYGLCLAKARSDFDAALKICKRAAESRPRDIAVRVNLGRVYRMRGNNLAAWKTFHKAWQQNKRHAAPALELTSMGIRRRPVIPFLPRSWWGNKVLGMLRSRIERAVFRG